MEFMRFWTRQCETTGFESVLSELSRYSAILRLNDLLHLGKHFRSRLLKYELTLCWGSLRASINRERLRQVLGYGPPLTDTTATGKMSDFDPLMIMRLDNVIALMEHGAHAEALALLPLSLCFGAIRLETKREGSAWRSNKTVHLTMDGTLVEDAAFIELCSAELQPIGS
jgi:hypothetical protein